MGEVGPPGPSGDRAAVGFTSSYLVTLTVVSFAASAALRVMVTLRRVQWGAATAQMVTWCLLAAGILVANPELSTTDGSGELATGWYVAVGATGFASLAGLLDHPLRRPPPAPAGRLPRPDPGPLPT